MFDAIEKNPQMLQKLAESNQDPQAFIHALRQQVASQQGGSIGGVLPQDKPLAPVVGGVGQALL